MLPAPAPHGRAGQGISTLPPWHAGTSTSWGSSGSLGGGSATGGRLLGGQQGLPGQGSLPAPPTAMHLQPAAMPSPAVDAELHFVSNHPSVDWERLLEEL